ncbi:DUF1045 domain-containing protein [Thermodesulfobacteriota bacterium B35]
MRYALCYSPDERSSLWQQLCIWLGRNPATGKTGAQPQFSDIEPDRLTELTRSPRRHGPCAVLKAPFRLAAGRTPQMLDKTLELFCYRHRPISLPPLAITDIRNTFCLAPAETAEDVLHFADRCVRRFEPFRAPLTPLETARRRAAILCREERRSLALWGYPWACETYRFLIPLTGRIADAMEKRRVLNAITRTFDGLLDNPPPLGDIALFVEQEPGRPFVLQKRFPLTATPLPGEPATGSDRLQPPATRQFPAGIFLNEE